MKIITPNTQEQVSPIDGLPMSKAEIEYNKTKSGFNKFAFNAPEGRDLTNSLTLTPEENNFQDYGFSPSVLGDNEETRAELQSGFEQMGHGFGKMMTTAGSTFLDGTIGTVVGATNWLTGGIGRYAEGDSDGFEFSDFWKNPFTEEVHRFNESMENTLPNYRTHEEESNKWWNNLGTANFWGDNILKNFGFTIGALGAGMLTGGVAGEALGGKAISQRILSDPKTMQYLKNLSKVAAEGQVAGKPVDVASKGIITGLLEADLTAAQIPAQLAKDAQALKWINNTQAILAQTVAASSEARLEAINGYNQYKEERTQELISKGVSQEEAEIQANDEGLAAGNIQFGINMPILLASNYTQFKNILGGGFADQSSKVGQILGDFTDGFTYKGLTRTQKGARLLKNSLTEGNEEMAQQFGQDFAKNYEVRKNDPDSKGMMDNIIKSTIQGFKDSYGNADQWEQFFAGALTGMVGMPNFGKIISKTARADKNQSWWAGGAYGEYKDMQQEDENTKKAVTALNNIPKYIGKMYDNNVIHFSYDKDKQQALKNGDQKEFKNLENEQFTHDVITSIEAGKYEDMLNFVKKSKGLTGAELRSMMQIKNGVKDEKTGKIKGSLVDLFANKSDNELKIYFDAKADRLLEKAEKIAKLKEQVDVKFSRNNVSDATKSELIRYLSNSMDHEDRINKLLEETKYYQAKATRIGKGDLSSKFSEIEQSTLEGDPIYDALDTNNLPAFFSEIQKRMKGKSEDEQEKELNDIANEYLKKLSVYDNNPDYGTIKSKIKDLFNLANERNNFVKLYSKAAISPEKFDKLMNAHVEDEFELATDNKLNTINTIEDFINLLKSKGYSGTKADTQNGIYIKHKDQKYLLKRDVAGKLKAYALDGTQNLDFESNTAFIEWLNKNKGNTEVLSKEEYLAERKKEKTTKFREAEKAALSDLINQTSSARKANLEELDKARTAVAEGEAKIMMLLDEYSKIESSKFTESEKEDLRTLISKQLEEVRNLTELYKKQVDDLSFENKKLNHIMSLYQDKLNYLKDNPDQFINAKEVESTEQQLGGLTDELILQYIDDGILQSDDIHELSNTIRQNEVLIDGLNKEITHLERYGDILQAFIDEDRDALDLINSFDFNELLQSKYPDSPELTPRMMKDVLSGLMKSTGDDFPYLVALNKYMSNPQYIKDITEIYKSKVEAERLGKDISSNKKEVTITKNKIKKLKSQLEELEELNGKLKDAGQALAFHEANTQFAATKFRNLSRLKYQERYREGRGIPYREDLKIDNTGELTEESKQSILDNAVEFNFKTLTPYATTGNNVQYEYNPETDTYETVYDQNGLPKLLENESQKRWFNFSNDNAEKFNNGEYQILFVVHQPGYTGDNEELKELNQEISNNLPVDKRTVGEDIHAIIYDKAGNLIRVGGKPLFTGIKKTSTIFIVNKAGENTVRSIDYKALIAKYNPGLGAWANLSPYKRADANMSITLDKVTKTAQEWLGNTIEDIDAKEKQKKEFFEAIDKEYERIYEQAKSDYESFRNTIKEASKEGNLVIGKVQGVTPGIPVLTDEKRNVNAVTDLKFGDDKNFKLTIQLNSATTSAGTESGYASGQAFIETEGKKIPVQTELLNKSQVDDVIGILQYAMPKGSEIVISDASLPKGNYLGTPDKTKMDIFPSQQNGGKCVLNCLINYGRSEKDAKRFEIWGKRGVTFINDKGDRIHVSREELHDKTSTGYKSLESFLSTKRFNINKAFIGSKFYFHPSVDKTGKITFTKHTEGYEKFLISKGKIQTKLIPQNTGTPQFVSRNVKFEVNSKGQPVINIVNPKSKNTVESEDDYIPTYDDEGNIEDFEFVDDEPDINEADFEKAKKAGSKMRAKMEGATKEEEPLSESDLMSALSSLSDAPLFTNLASEDEKRVAPSEILKDMIKQGEIEQDCK